MDSTNYDGLVFYLERTIYILLSICLVFYISSYHFVKYILLLTSVPVLLLFIARPKQYFSNLSKIDITWFAVLIFYPLSYYFSFLIHNGPLDLHRANHVLLDCITGIMLYLLLRKKELFTLGTFCRITAASIAIAGTVVTWWWISHNFHGRWSIGTNLYLIFATVASAASLMCFWYFANSEEKLWTRLGFLYAGIVGTISIIAAGTRGAWLVLIFMFCLYLFIGILKRKKALLIFPIIVVGLSIIWAMQAHVGNERFHGTIEGLEKFIQTGKITDTSFDMRIDMWRAAVDHIKSRPLSGVGSGKFKDTFIGTHFRYKALYNFDHVHNDILQAWSALGIFGLISILALIAIPIWIALSVKSPITPYLIILAMVFALNGLVDVPFLKIYSLKYYLIVASLLITLQQKYKVNPA